MKHSKYTADNSLLRHSHALIGIVSKQTVKRDYKETVNQTFTESWNVFIITTNIIISPFIDLSVVNTLLLTFIARVTVRLIITSEKATKESLVQYISQKTGLHVNRLDSVS